MIYILRPGGTLIISPRHVFDLEQIAKKILLPHPKLSTWHNYFCRCLASNFCCVNSFQLAVIACWFSVYIILSICSFQWENNQSSTQLVDVVIDPHICQHLRPHQRDGVVFLYECVLGYRNFNGHGVILGYGTVLNNMNNINSLDTRWQLLHPSIASPGTIQIEVSVE